jgi:hypothetical protein
MLAKYMYELKRTKARKVFKDLLGHANHFLITILVGLNGVRVGKIEHDEEFHAAWNPPDIQASANRSRQFAIDLALIRAIDALDSYMMHARRGPSILGSKEFEQSMDGAKSIAERLKVFLQFIPSFPEESAAFLRLANAWRNCRVHSLAENDISKNDRDMLLKNSSTFQKAHNGLIIKDCMKRFEKHEPLTFKDVASIIKLIHKTVEYFDGHLLSMMDVEIYVHSNLRAAVDFEEDLARLRRTCHKIWGSMVKREAKVIHILKLVGVHEVNEITVKEIPTPLIDRIIAYTPEEALEWLSS